MYRASRGRCAIRKVAGEGAARVEIIFHGYGLFTSTTLTILCIPRLQFVSKRRVLWEIVVTLYGNETGVERFRNLFVQLFEACQFRNQVGLTGLRFRENAFAET